MEQWEKMYKELYSAAAKMRHEQEQYFADRKRGYDAKPQLQRAKAAEHKVDQLLKAGKEIVSPAPQQQLPF